MYNIQNYKKNYQMIMTMLGKMKRTKKYKWIFHPQHDYENFEKVIMKQQYKVMNISADLHNFIQKN